MTTVNEVEARKLEMLVPVLLDKHAERQSMHEPLTNILGDYSKNPMKRAIRNVMFEKQADYSCGKPRKMWVVRKYPGVKKSAYVSFITKKILSEFEEIMKIIKAKNRTLMHFSQFKNKYWPKLKKLEEDKAYKIIHSVYEDLVKAYKIGIQHK